MTPKQEERIRKKIVDIKKALAEDKKRWGGFYDDSRGLRYMPPQHFIKLKDYKGGLRYLRWFWRTFPDDSGFPIFLFEETLILFKTGKLKEAESKAYKTFAANNYLFDKFLGKELLKIEKNEFSNWEKSTLTDYLTYSKSEIEFSDFAEWIHNFLTSENFYKFTNEFIEIEKQLQVEPVGKKRSALIDKRSKLLSSFSNNPQL
jgi:hypothetical protein